MSIILLNSKCGQTPMLISYTMKEAVYGKRDDFDFDIVNFPFLDGDVPGRPSYGVYISQHIRFARVYMGRTDFSDQFRKIIRRQKLIGYDLDVKRQPACLVMNPITVDNFAALFNCTPVDRTSDTMMARPKAIHFS